MNRQRTQSAGEPKLWLRLLLVAVTGAVPLFVVSLLLVRGIYRTALDFGAQEQRGLAFQRRLEHVIGLVPRYVSSVESAAGAPAAADAAAAQRDLDQAIQALGHDYQSELGEQLGLREPALRARGRDEASLSVLETRWQVLQHARGSRAAVIDAGRELLSSVRAMAEQTADGSNLILDQELDSYYLMDIAMMALPRAQQRLFDVQVLTHDLSRGEPAARSQQRLAVVAALLREADLERIERDTRRALGEDSQFNGTSASLQARLPLAARRYSESSRRLLSLLERTSTGEALPFADLETSVASAQAASLDLFRTSAAELDGLLAARLRAVENRRLETCAAILATFLVAVLGMGLLIRSLLAARYAEIMKAQHELRAKEEQLSALGDNLPGGMTYQIQRELDGSMRFLYLSSGVEQLHGVSVEAAMKDASALYQLIVEEDRPALQSAELESFRQEKPFRHLARSRRKTDGQVRWFEYASAPRELPDGRVIWDGIQMDVTDRKEAEFAAQQTQARFTHIFDKSPIPITLSDAANGRLVAVNASFVKYSGYSPEEAIGRTPQELQIYAKPEQRAEIVQQLRDFGRAYGVEISFRSKDGSVLANQVWVDELTIGADKFVMAMSLDVTERNAAMRQQRELEEQLRQTQKLEALGTLAGGIAHDFNNILGAIISYTELSKLDNPDNQLLHDNLEQVLGASQRAAVLVRQILSFSRHQKEERRALQLAPIVKEVLSLLRATLPSTIALDPLLDSDVSDVLANATQVHQIVMNLCTNAAHAMRGKQGKITLAIALIELSPQAPKPHVDLGPGRYVRLAISDTGHGMDAVTLQRIFEPFFTTKPLGEGTGLGLSVVHGIVKEYGGAVVVESELGKGTKFTIYLPAISGTELQTLQESAEVPRGRGERILFVDDEVVLGGASRKMLERLGYQVTLFHSSVAALLAFRQAPDSFSALVTDYTMPEMTGVELIREVHAIRPDLPVIMVSGSSGPLDPADVRRVGMRELLSKPLGYAALAHALRRALTPAPVVATSQQGSMS